MLAYGLGRHVEFSDEQAVDEILTQSKKEGYRVGDLIHTIVSHPVFRRGDPKRMAATDNKKTERTK